MLTSVLPSLDGMIPNLTWFTIIQAVAILVLGVFLLGGIFRLFFGKGSSLNRAVSASLSIFLVYLAAILIYLFMPELRESLEPLPFIKIDLQHVCLIDWIHLEGTTLYPSVLKLAILALIVNLMEEFMPEGSKIFSWYLWRTVTVLASLTAYAILCAVIKSFAPQIFGGWAEYILWGFVLLIVLTGILKILLGLVLTVINPIIGGLYALFFTNLFGKQFSKSILTTLLVMVLFKCAYHTGMQQFSFSEFSIAAYGPSCIIILIVLYLFGKIL